MATSVYTTLNPTTSFVSVYSSTGSFLYKAVQLPVISPSTLERIVVFKEASEYPGVPLFAISSSGTDRIETSTTIGLYKHQALTLQAVQSSTTSYWSLLGGYLGTSVFSTQMLPVNSVPVYPSTISQVFVDLRTQSKTVVLPKIQTLAQQSSSALFLTVKDAYGFASSSTLYISSSYPDKLEISSINNAIGIQQNFGSVDLVANPVLSKWNLVNWYNGGLVLRT